GLVVGGKRAVCGKANRRFDFRIYFALDGFPARNRQLAGKAAQRIRLVPGPGFFLRAITRMEILGGSDMLFPAIAQSLEKVWPPPARADIVDRPPGLAR